MTKIAVFFGGKISRHLVLVRKAAKKLGVELDLISYNKVFFDTENGRVELKGKDASDYDVLFFRTTGKHWEEVDLILESLKGKKKPIIVDPIVEHGKPSFARKAWQMLRLTETGIEVPRTIYGSLWTLYEYMCNLTPQNIFSSASSRGGQAHQVSRVAAARCKNILSESSLHFPVIIKGSGGNRGERVFKANNLEELEKLVRELRKSETEDGRRYMLQEYIENDGDYRVLVIGDKALGAMKRSSQSRNEFRNNYSAGGKVEVAQLPQEIYDLAVRAAKSCGIAIAGVDVAFRDKERKRPVVWEVNKGPQFKGFMKATGIDAPAEIVKYLASLKDSKNS